MSAGWAMEAGVLDALVGMKKGRVTKTWFARVAQLTPYQAGRVLENLSAAGLVSVERAQQGPVKRTWIGLTPFGRKFAKAYLPAHSMLVKRHQLARKLATRNEASL